MRINSSILAGSDNVLGVTRRSVLSALAGLAGCTQIPAGIKNSSTDSSVLDQLVSGHDSKRRVVIKDATILSQDRGLGDFARADIFFEGAKIVAVGHGLANNVGDAVTVNALGMVAIPGFVDAHRHAWEGQLRGLLPDSDIAEYMAQTHRGFAPFYRPTDMYAGNLISAVGALEAGITCMIDNSHNSRSSAHSDAAVQALLDSGIRGVHASGAPTFAEWDKQWPADLARLKKKFFSSNDQLVTLRMYELGLRQENVDVANDLDLWITSEGLSPQHWVLLQDWNAKGKLSSKRTLNHMYGAIPSGTWAAIREKDISVNVCPRSDSQYALGRGIGGLQAVLDNGIRPGLSVDNEASYGTDMFTEMRVGFFLQRAVAQMRKADGETSPPKPLGVKDMLEFATTRGAWCAGLLKNTGTISPGKQADIILIRGNDLNTVPMTNAAATVVSYASTQNVDTVIVGGHVRKWRGMMQKTKSGMTMDEVKRLAMESRDYLFRARNYSFDVTK